MSCVCWESSRCYYLLSFSFCLFGGAAVAAGGVSAAQTMYNAVYLFRASLVKKHGRKPDKISE